LICQEFPPKSTLDTTVYGDQNSTITEEHLETNLGDITVEEVMIKKMLELIVIGL